MKRLREDGKITPRKREDGKASVRVLVSTVGSDFRLIVLSSKEPFVISRFLSFGSVFISVLSLHFLFSFSLSHDNSHSSQRRK
jgi:hypothetical protein